MTDEKNKKTNNQEEKMSNVELKENEEHSAISSLSNELKNDEVLRPVEEIQEEVIFSADEENFVAPIEAKENTKPQDANIGALLKRIREEKGHSLKLVSQQTKIHLALLESLEDNQLIRLPSKTYVKGFVKAYAKLLNISQNEAIELFENTYREYEGLPPIHQERSTPSIVASIPKKEIQKENKINEITKFATYNSSLILKVGVALFVVVVIGINLKSMIERTMEEKAPELPLVISTTMKQPKKIVPKVAPPVTEEKPVETAPQQINIITKDAIKPEVKLNEELTLKPISAVEKQQKELNFSKEQMNEFFPAKYRIAPAAGTEMIFINATEGDSWLTYKTDDNEIKKFVLRQGRTLFLKGKEIRLFIGNTKALKVFYNGKPIELLTTTGVKNAVFPEDLKGKYMNPLFVFQKDGTVITSEEAAQKAKESEKGATSVPQKNTQMNQ